MTRKLLSGIAIIFLLLFWTGSLAANEVTVFGPEDFKINWFRFHFSIKTFKVPTPGEGKIIIHKNYKNKKIKQGFVLLNGQYISLHRFLRSKEATLEKEVSLRSRNFMMVFLRGKKGASISIEVRSREALDPPIAVLTADPNAITIGETSTLNWQTRDAETVSIDQGIGDVELNGSFVVTPQRTTTYTLTAIGPGGTTTRSVVIDVFIPVPSIGFQATPTQITRGESTELNWSTEYAHTVTIIPGIGQVDLNGILTLSPVETTSYTLTAVGDGGTSTAELTVTVIQPPPTIQLSANPPDILLGNHSTLSWSSSFTDTVIIEPDIGEVGPGGSILVSPVETTTYIATASGLGGTANAEVTINVTDPNAPPTVSFDDEQCEIQPGDSCTLSWGSTKAASAYIDNGVGVVALNDSVAVSPEYTTLYTISVSGETGSAKDQMLVKVLGSVAPMDDQAYGKLYEDLIPTDAVVKGYDEQRFSLIRGQVLDINNNPITDVMVKVHGMPQYGTTLTDWEGMFTIPVEGGSTHTLHFWKKEFIEAQRKVFVPWNEIVIINPFQLVTLDSKESVFTFDGSADTIGVHESTIVSDEFGDRSITLVFTGDNRAFMVDEFGNDVRELHRITTRASEFTTLESMPGELPPQTGYTYCVELTLDGIPRVRFEKAVTAWVDNFLEFDVGDVVPVGYYDRKLADWVPQDNGLVVRLLDLNGDGVVDALDGDGDDQPDDLNGNGSFSDEVNGLNNPDRYKPGDSFWRFSVTHFTPWDCNWPYGPPQDAIRPEEAPRNDEQEPDECKLPGASYVEERNRILHEDIEIPGTDLKLHYSSSRTTGHKYEFTIPISGPTVPASLSAMIVTVDVAGKRYTYQLDPAPNQVINMLWDGLDFRGDPIHHDTARTSIGYQYGAVYYSSRSDWSRSFARVGGSISGSSARQTITLWRRFAMTVTSPYRVLSGELSLGKGWTLSDQHSFDPKSRTLHKGDGGTLKNNGARVHYRFRAIDSVTSTFAGTGIRGYSGDGGLAIEANLYYPNKIIADAGGLKYFSTRSRIRTVDQNGVINTLAGIGYYGYSGDGGPSTEAAIARPDDMAFDEVGNLYFADSDNWVIRKIDTSGIISTVAGIGYFEESQGKDCTCSTATCEYGTCSGEQPSIARLLTAEPGTSPVAQTDPPVCGCDPFLCSACNESEGIFCEYCGCEGIDEYLCMVSDCVCQEDPNAGNGDGGLASAAKIKQPLGVAVDTWGNIYIADTGSNRIRKVGADGVIETLAGGESSGYAGDGGPAAAALFNSPQSLEIDKEGNLYILDRYNYRVRKIDSAGVITTVAGNGLYGVGSDDIPAVDSPLNDARDIFLDGNGDLYIVELNRVRKVDSKGNIITLAGVAGGGFRGDGYPSSKAVFSNPTGVMIDNEHSLFIVDQANQRVRAITPNTPYMRLESLNARVYVDEKGKGHQFEDGKHVKIIDPDTAITLKTFQYENDRLVSIVDRFNRITAIERESSGKPISITSPHGLKTTLQIDERDLLTDVLLPDGSLYHFEYTAEGLLTEKTDRQENLYRYLFNPFGRVVEVNNEEGGKWTFSRDSQNRDYEQIDILSAEGDLAIYQDFKESWGNSMYKITDPTGAVRTISENRNGTEISTVDACDINSSHSYGLDLRYRTKQLKEQNLTTPAGLTKSYQINRDYTNNLITDRVSINYKTTSSTLDFPNSRRTIRTPLGREINHYFDLQTLLRQRTELPGSHDIVYLYDLEGRLASRSIGSRSEAYTYNGSGFLESITEPGGIITSYDTDPLGRITKVTRPNGSIFNFQYDKNGNMTVFTNSKDIQHRFGFNKTNAKNLYQTPLSGDYTYLYDRDGRLVQTNFPSGKQISNTYNQSRLTEIATSEGLITLDYHCGSKLRSTSKGNNKIVLDYDGNLVTSDVRSGDINQSLGYSYNNDFDIRDFTYAGKTVTYSYDNDGLLTRSGNFTIGRNAQSGLVESIGDGTYLVNQGYNAYSELASESHLVGGSTVAGWNVVHNDNGKIVEKTEVLNGLTIQYGYTYDKMGQLLTVSKDGVVVEEYRYDPSGVRNFERNDLRGITGRAFSYSDEDQVLAAGSSTYQYNDDGFLSRKTVGSNVTVYNYSSRGELLSVTLPDSELIEYTHDPYGARVTKKINGSLVEKYLWEDEIKLLAVFDGADNLKMRFGYAGDRVPVGMVKDGQVYYLTYSNIRSLQSVVDTSGTVVKQIDYDAFGNIINDTNPGFTVPFGFAGGLHDKDTGLVRFGARDYDSDTGRWTAKDPIGIHGEETDLYGYVLNDPINFVDPSGELLHVPALVVWIMITAAVAGQVVILGESLNPPPYNKPYVDEPLEEQQKFPMKCKPAHVQAPKNAPVRPKNKNLNKRRTPYKKLQRGRAR